MLATLEQALLHLAAAGPKGFAHFDAPFGITLAERVRVGVELTPTERRSAARLLDRYHDLLAADGVELPVPPGPMDAPGLGQVRHEDEPPPRTSTVQAYVKSGQIILVTPYVLREISESIPGGRWSKFIKPAGARVFATSPSTAHQIQAALGPHGLEYDAEFAALVEGFTAQAAAAVHKKAEDLPPIPGETLPSWLHQRRALWFAKDLSAAVLAMGMGCIAGDSVVTVNRAGNSRRVTIATLHDRLSGGHWDESIPTRIRALKADGTIGLVTLVASLDKGLQPVVRLTLEDGKSIVCTPDHEIVDADGVKVHAETLHPGDLVQVDPGVPRKGSAIKKEWQPRKPYPKQRRKGLSVDGKGYSWLYEPRHPNANRQGQVLEHVKVMSDHLGRALVAPEVVHHLNDDKLNNALSNLVLCVDQAEHSRYHDWTANLPGRRTVLTAVRSVKDAGERRVYDLSVLDDAHTYVANGFVVGNTGKSKVTIDLLRLNGARNVLIMCPKRVVGVWPKQFEIHAPGRFHVVTGRRQMQRGKRAGRWELMSVAERTRLFDDALHECRCTKPHVILANYEITVHGPFNAWALRQDWDYVVLDEGHRIRAAQGEWSKWCAKLRPKAKRRLLLSGTVMGQSPLDVFGQYRFADPGIFGTSNTAFKKRYAIETEAYKGAGLGPGDAKRVVALRTHPRLPDGRRNPDYSPDLARDFDARLFSIMYEVDSDVLDLPESLTVTRDFDLPPAVQKSYDEIETEMFTVWANANEMSTPNVLVKMLRLAQLTGGVLTDDDDKSKVIVDESKAELLEDVLTDIDPAEPIIVFCRFVHDLDSVQSVAQRLGRPYVELSGRRDDALNADATLSIDRGIAGVQIQAGGVGVDLTKARIAIDYSLGHSRIDYEQSRKRLVRPGQTRGVLFVRLVANGTIDQDIFDALEATEDIVQFVMKRRSTRTA